MSETTHEILQFIKAKYNPTTCTTDLIFLENGIEKILPMTDELMHELIETIPIFNEEKAQRDILKKIYEVREKRILTVAKIDELIDEIREKHDDAQTKLKSVNDKLSILKWNSIIKSLSSEKTTLDTKRHLIRMLVFEEADLRAQLAKREAGKR